MKRLVNDVGRCLIKLPTSGARRQYEQHLKTLLQGDRVEDGLKSSITAIDANTSLLDFYLGSRTKASFQGSGDLGSRVRETLGISKSVISDAKLKGLDDFFIVRNSIVHSMDYKKVDKSNSTAREHRSSDDVTRLCNGAFAVAADLIHAAGDVVLATRIKPVKPKKAATPTT